MTWLGGMGLESSPIDRLDFSRRGFSPVHNLYSLVWKESITGSDTRQPPFKNIVITGNFIPSAHISVNVKVLYSTSVASPWGNICCIHDQFFIQTTYTRNGSPCRANLPQKGNPDSGHPPAQTPYPALCTPPEESQGQTPRREEDNLHQYCPHLYGTAPLSCR